MNTKCSVINNEGFFAITRNRGVSDEANTINGIVNDIRMSFNTSVSIGWYQIAQILIEVAVDSSRDNWDGYQAKSVNAGTLYEALRFSSLLPSSIPFPEIAADTDGEMVFEWYNEPDQIFTVIVENDNRIIYAGSFDNDNKVNGTEYFSDELPKTILDNLQRLYS